VAIDERWLASVWPFVLAQLPPAPASVLEVGCGTLGGFVPRLQEGGYEAVGVDRNAPAGERYRHIDFEHYEPSPPVDVIVACRSLHHVGDLDEILGRVAAALHPGGAVAIVEWAWERFDEETARWCFERLGATTASEEPGWLQRRRDGWSASGRDWHEYFGDWAEQGHLTRSDRIIAGLDARFERTLLEYAPYFYSDLPVTSEQAERDAIDAGEIRATGIRYAGTLRSTF
jgi:SAM-dependent methyltransferase